tara:strand:+ start:280 stop:534 length:255 start_codon:yes stop_codon:yes gene_type:complete
MIDAIKRLIEKSDYIEYENRTYTFGLGRQPVEVTMVYSACNNYITDISVNGIVVKKSRIDEKDFKELESLIKERTRTLFNTILN